MSAPSVWSTVMAVVVFTIAIPRNADAPSVMWTTMSPPPGGVGALAPDGGQLLAVGYTTDSVGITTPAAWTSTTGRGWTAPMVQDDDEGLMQTAVRFQGDLLARRLRRPGRHRVRREREG